MRSASKTIAGHRAVHIAPGFNPLCDFPRDLSGRHSAVATTRREFLIGGLTLVAAASTPARADAAALIVADLRGYRSALARASSQYETAIVDIRADWCAFCKTIDQKILPDSRVRRAMERIGLIKVDVTRMDQSSRKILQHLRADGPPTLFVVQTASGREVPGTRSVGFFSTDDLLRRLHPFA